MKSLFLLILAVVCFGCAPRNEFDITPAQAKQVRRIGGPMDLKNLPAGAVKHEKVFHKGDILPDGTVAPGERKMVTIDIKR